MLMLFLSVCGMAIGLAIDCGATPPDLLAALCTASTGSLATSLAFHVTMMPASYVAMTAAAILAAAFAAATPEAAATRGAGRRAAGALVSVGLMLVGMFAGGWLAPEIAAGLGAEAGFATIVFGMTGGMVAATVAAGAITRAVDAATARSGRKRLQYIMYQ
jgi:hypothetical protein